MKDFWFLFWAYTFIWGFVAVYVGFLVAKQRSVKRQIRELQSRLERDGAADA